MSNYLFNYRFFNYIKNFKRSNDFRLLLASLPIILFIFNYLLIQDFRLVDYDSEPDYIANGLHILEYKIPISVHHPATFSYYLISIPLKVCEVFELSLSQTIMFIRFLLISNLLAFISFFHNKSIIKIYKYSVFIFLIPGLSVFLGTITAEILLFPISVLIIRLLKKEKLNAYLLGIILAIGFSIKLSIILLFPIIFIFLIIKNKNVKYYLKLISTYAISLLFFQFPVLPGFILLLESKIKNTIWIFCEILGISNSYIFILLLFVILGMIVIIIMKNKDIFFQYLKLRYQLICFLYALALLIIGIIISNLDNWNFIRHIIPIAPFILEYDFNNKLKIHKYYFYIIIISFLLGFVLFFKKSIDYSIPTEFDQFVIENSDKIIMTSQDRIFNSEYLFKEWSKYRYGNSNESLYQRFGKEYQLQFINYRNLDCNDYSSFSEFSYFKKWYLSHYQFNEDYYPFCIDEQIEMIVNDKAILTTFFGHRVSNNNITKLKNILSKRGYTLFKVKAYKEFIVWDLNKIDN